MIDPIAEFNQWLAEAVAHPAISEPTAMTLATATPQGMPSARIVLLKKADAAGFLFYTNYTSLKSRQMLANPFVALTFYWMPLGRQVRAEGSVQQAGADESDDYFASRPRARQLGAWASLQSQPLESREELEARFTALAAEYEGKPIPRPPHWGGWRVVPRTVEFWTASDERLHLRHVYTQNAPGQWTDALLYP